MKNNLLKTKSNSEFPENQRKGNNNWLNRQSLIVISSAILVFIIIMVIVNIEPINEISKFNDKYRTETINDPQLLKLMEEDAFLQSRLKMAMTDSIGLTLNLNDSTLSLEIQGVKVHTSKILKITKSHFLDKISPSAKINWVRSPFRIISHEASIPKDPLTITKAPKDTIEAAQNSSKVIDTIPEYISYSLTLDKDLLIEISQSNDSLPSWAKQSPSYLSKKWDGFKETSSSIFGLKNKDYKPSILIEIPFHEARSIYRAIPDKAMVTITY